MRNLIAVYILSVLWPLAAMAEEAKVYRWVDEDGNVFYGDSIPAEYAERPKEVLNEHGVIVENLEGKKTPEQLEAERLAEERAKQMEQQRIADQALLNTYLSVEEIEMHRERRLELFQAQARVTELYLRNLERLMNSLREEAAAYKPYSENPSAPMIDPALAEDIQETRSTIERHQRNLKKYASDEQMIRDRFDADIARFKVLKGIED